MLRQRLLEGVSGAEVMAALTEFVDGLIIGRYRNAMRQAGEEARAAGAQHCCLVALGGYGYRGVGSLFRHRRHAPLFEKAGEAAPALFREVLHHLWDLGFQVGHSMRTVQDCVDLAAKDLTIRTSMMSVRFLTGSPYLFQEFHRRYFREVVGRGTGHFIEQRWKSGAVNMRSSERPSICWSRTSRKAKEGYGISICSGGPAWPGSKPLRCRTWRIAASSPDKIFSH